MRAVLLAGGYGSRMAPFTKVINKHLSPVYLKDKAVPMIDFPLETLKSIGITDVLIISSKEHCGSIIEYLGNGRDKGLDLTYKIQDMEKEAGIAGALNLARDFVNDESFCVILGDNYFEFNESIEVIKQECQRYQDCGLLLKKVDNPQDFGVAVVNEDNEITYIVEKPKEFISDLAITGLYFYPPDVFDVIKTLKPSKRGELEISEINDYYCKVDKIVYGLLDTFWSDCGKPDSMNRVIEHLNE